MDNQIGRNPLPVVDSFPYSQLIFLVSSGKDYALSVAEARGKKDSSPTAKQLKQLVRMGYLKAKKEKVLNKTIYNVNWKNIIRAFIIYLRKNADYVSSENKSRGMNLDKIIKDFDGLLNKLGEKDFENSLKINNSLMVFFKKYYSTIGELGDNWTLTHTFDFLVFFGDMNFLYSWGASHNFYNLEKFVYFINNQDMINFPDWLSEHKSAETEEEKFERFKKIEKYNSENFNKINEKITEQLKEIILKNKEVYELYTLTKIFEIVKIKPTLQLGLTNAIRETGKNIFLNALSKEEIKKYLEIKIKNSAFNLGEREEAKQILKEIFNEEEFDKICEDNNKFEMENSDELWNNKIKETRKKRLIKLKNGNFPEEIISS